MRRLLLILLVILAMTAVLEAGKKNKKNSKLNKKINAKYSGKFTHKSIFKHGVTHKVTHKIKITHEVNFFHDIRKQLPCDQKCIPASEWHEGHCVCQRGLVGVGDLCCSNPDKHDYHCETVGDPHLTTSENQQAQLFNPCGQLLAVIKAKTRKRKSCKITVRSTDVIHHGEFITSQVVIGLEIGNSASQYILLNGNKFAKTKKLRSSSKLKWRSLPKRGSKCLSIHKVKVSIEEDVCHQLWKVKACGTIITFRRNVVEGGKPGVCIVSKFRNSLEASDDHSVCKRLPNDDFGNYNSKAVYYLARSFEHSEYLNLRLGCYHKVCRGVTKTFNECDPSRKTKAINTCSLILKIKFRKSAYLFHQIDGVRLVNLFSDCMRAYCSGDQRWCYETKKTSAFLSVPVHGIRCCDFKLKPPPPPAI